MALAETAKLAVNLSLKDGLTPGLRKAGQSVSRFDAGMRRTGKGISQLGGSLAKIGVVAGTVAAVGLYKAAQAAINWEDAFQGVVKTVDAAELERAGLTFDKLAMSLRDMSLEMPNTAIELAGIAETAGALGIKAADIEAFTRQVAILASTTNVSADEAATSLGQLQNVIGLTGGEFDNFAAALVDLGNKGASTESQILEIARRAGAAAKLFGIAKDETLGWAAAAANLGMEPELAGSSLQRVFMKLLPSFARGENKMAEFMGMTNKGMKRAFGKDASGMLQKFIKKLSTLPKDAKLEAIQGFFGKEGVGIQRLILGLADSMDTNLTPSLETSTEAWADATAAQIEFEKRNATVKSAVQRLRNGITDAAVTIGEGFAPALGRAAEKLAAFLKDPSNRSQLKTLGEDIGKAIDSIEWDKVLRAAKGIAAALKPALALVMKLAEMIAKLPPELVGGAATLIIADKATGGGISGGVGNILGGLGETLARSLASKIPLFGAAFVQPVFVTNMGLGSGMGGGNNVVPGGGTGKLGSVLKNLMKVALIGVAVDTAVQLWNVKEQQTAANNAQSTALEAQASGYASTATQPELQNALKGVREEMNRLNNSWSPEGLAYALNIDGVRDTVKDVEGKLDRQLTAAYDTNSEAIAQRQTAEELKPKMDALKQKQAEAVTAFRTAERTFANQKPPVVNVGGTKVYITAHNVTSAVAVRDRYDRGPSRHVNANKPVFGTD